MLVRTKAPYDEDFLLWTQEQAHLLREAAQRGINLPLDWENLAEEVEGLGRAERQELRSRLTTIIEHLLKLEHSPQLAPREGWEETIRRSRKEIEFLLEDNPSLRREVPALTAAAFTKFAEFPVDQLIRRAAIDPRRRDEILALPYSEEQVLGPWVPGASSLT